MAEIVLSGCTIGAVEVELLYMNLTRNSMAGQDELLAPLRRHYMVAQGEA